MVKHTICWLLTTNCLSVFDHFVGLTLKGLKVTSTKKLITSENSVFGAQFTNIFILWKGHIPFFGYSAFYVLKQSIKFESYGTMMSIKT